MAGLGKLVHNAVNTVSEATGMTNNSNGNKGTFVGNAENDYENNNNSNNNSAAGGLMVGVIVFVVTLLLILLLGKFLWNNALVPLVPACNRANSVWQVFGVAVLVSLLTGN